jgi:general stress protein 26
MQLAGWILLLARIVSWGASPQAPSREAILAASRTIVTNARYATLATNGPGTQPSARIIDPFPPEPDFTVFFATTAASRKVSEIRANGRVTLLYFDAPNKGYVAIQGKAVLTKDPRMLAKYWKDDWAAFYKNKSRGDDYALFRVEPETIEVVSVALGMNNDPATWKPVTLRIR